MTDGSRTLKIARSDAANINWSNRVREHTNLLDEPLKQIGIHICEIYDTIAYFARCSRFTFWHGIWALIIRLERTIPGPRIGLSNPLNQPGTFDRRWIVGATIGAAVVPNPYRLQAGNTDEATSFENHPMFHAESLGQPQGSGNGLFGAGKKACSSRGRPQQHQEFSGKQKIPPGTRNSTHTTHLLAISRETRPWEAPAASGVQRNAENSCTRAPARKTRTF